MRAALSVLLRVQARAATIIQHLATSLPDVPMSPDPFFTIGQPNNQPNNEADNQTAAAESTPKNEIRPPQQPALTPQTPAPTTPTAIEDPAAETHEAHSTLEAKLDKIDQPHPNQPTNTSAKVTKNPKKARSIKTPKTSSSISFKGLAIGCLLFGLLLVVGISFRLYSSLQNPSQQRTIIPRESGQMALQMFAILFFSIIFFAGALLTFLNGYRFFARKTKRLAYGLTSIIGIVLLVLSLGVGIPVVSAIRADQAPVSNNTVEPYILLADGYRYMFSSPKVLLIAPVNVRYQLNQDAYRTRIVPQLGAADIQGVTLHCGNGQQVAYQDGWFDDCLYTQNEPYQVSLQINYIDRQTTQRKDKIISLATLTMDGALDIQSNVQNITRNTNQTELLVGEAPVKLSIDAQSLITNFGMETNAIDWDVDGDGQGDLAQTAKRNQRYVASRLHEVFYKLSDISPYVYRFAFRVQQPDTPICQVGVVQQAADNYAITADFIEGAAVISQYAFTIRDLQTGNDLDTIKTTRNSISYDMTRAGQYLIQVTFVTQDGKTGRCESDAFRVGDIPYQVSYQLQALDPAGNPLAPIATDPQQMQLQSVPATIQGRVTSVRPYDAANQVSVSLDGDPLILTADDTFSSRITQARDHTLTIAVTNTITQQTQIVEQLTIQVQQPALIGKLKVIPDTVGTDPFTVRFDASTTSINDPADEIVYFTWDFGDDEVKPNISQAVIEHTYYFDNQTQNGIYEPSVTITTKKGRTLTIRPDNNIIVKKAARQAQLAIVSHPAQVAAPGESVKFAVTVDGMPREVLREFGEREFVCRARECMDMNHIFTDPGTYDISVRITYDDHPDVTDSVKLRVQ